MSRVRPGRLAAALLGVAAGLAVGWGQPAAAWEGGLGPDGVLGLTPGGPVAPGEKTVVGVVGIGTHPSAEQVALTMQAASGYLAGPGGASIPLDRLEWAFRRHPGEALAFRPLQAGPVAVYRATGGWSGDVVWRFGPRWADRAASYQVGIAYTLSPASVDATPAVVRPDPYPLGSGESLEFYLYRPAAGSVFISIWPQPQGGCSTAPGLNWGRYYPVKAGWNRLTWAPGEASFPVTRPGPYCFAVAGNVVGPMIAGGSLLAVEAGALGTVRVTVEGSSDGRPLPRVDVRLGAAGAGWGRSARTGEDGTALFSALAPGSYRVEAEAAGYTAASQSVRLAPGQAEAAVALRLQPAPAARLGVEVAGPTPGRPAAVGDPVWVRVWLEVPAGGPGGQAEVQVDMGAALAVVPGSWAPEPPGPVGAVRWEPPVLVWERPSPPGSRVALRFQAVVTPLARGRASLPVRVQGRVRWQGGEAAARGASATLLLDRTGRADMGLVLGRVRAESDRALPSGLSVQADDGSRAEVDAAGFFTLALPEGPHLLWVQQEGPGIPPALSRGRPTALVVRAGSVVPASLRAPSGGSPGEAGGGIGVDLSAAGRLEWAAGGAADASGGVAARLAGTGLDLEGSAAVSAEGVRLGLVTLRAGSHRAAVGELRPNRVASSTGSGRLPSGRPAPLESLSLGGEPDLPARGAAWSWEEDGVRVLALHRMGQDGSEEQRPRSLVVVRAEPGPAALWVGAARRDPAAAGDDPGGWEVGAGWERPGRQGWAAVEFVRGPGGGGWGLSADDGTRTLTMRLVQGQAAVRLGQPADAPRLPAGDRLDVAWRTALDGSQPEAAALDLGARLGRAADLYAGIEASLPAGEGRPGSFGGAGSEGAAVASIRAGGVLGGDAAGMAGSGLLVRPYLQATLAAPALRAGPVAAGAGVRLWPVGADLAPAAPWESWLSLAASAPGGASASLKASVRPEGGAPLLSLQGALEPARALRLSSRAAGAGSLRWEEAVVELGRPPRHARLRWAPGCWEAEAGLGGVGPEPAGRPAQAPPDGWQVRIAAASGCPQGADPREPGVRLGGWWQRRALSGWGRLEIAPAASQAEGSVRLALEEAAGSWAAGAAELYAGGWWRAVAADAPAARVETAVLRVGGRLPVVGPVGLFGELERYAVRISPGITAGSPGAELAGGSALSVGTYAALEAGPGGSLLEVGWRAASHGLDAPPAALPAPLRAGCFVRLSGWWTVQEPGRYNMP